MFCQFVNHTKSAFILFSFVSLCHHAQYLAHLMAKTGITLLSLPGRYAGVRGLELDNLEPPPAGGRGPPHHEPGGAGPRVLVVDNVLPREEAAQSRHCRGGYPLPRHLL